MDNKTKAEHFRKAAEHLSTAGVPSDANYWNDRADGIDPQPEWKEGDLVRDAAGRLWEFSDGFWWGGSGTSSVCGYDDKWMGDDNGPLRRVHLADPANGEVVVKIPPVVHESFLRAWVAGLRSSAMRSSTEDLMLKIVANAAQAAGLLDEEA